MKRNIIRIDEDKCTGCGLCIPDCPEGALKIVEGKAKLVKESLCDGLGACLGKCPFGALTLEEREAEDFDEIAAAENEQKHAGSVTGQKNPEIKSSCPGAAMLEMKKGVVAGAKERSGCLRNWPIQLKLLNPRAPYLANASLVVAADCVAFALRDFHDKFAGGKVVIIFCPKLDNAREEYVEKLRMIFKENEIRQVTTVRMEVPCCSGTTAMVQEAVKISGKDIAVQDHIVSLRGELI